MAMNRNRVVLAVRNNLYATYLDLKQRLVAFILFDRQQRLHVFSKILMTCALTIASELNIEGLNRSNGW